MNKKEYQSFLRKKYWQEFYSFYYKTDEILSVAKKMGELLSFMIDKIVEEKYENNQ